MQVATLFRESTSLLGASMEGNGGSSDTGASGLGQNGPMSYDSYAHPLNFSNKYKINMKLEPQDDGYETGADMLMPNNVANMVKCEKLEDPYSFIDDDPIPMLPSVQHHGPPPSNMMSPMPMMNNQLLAQPKKRGRKKKVKLDEPEFGQELNGGIPRPIKERKKHDRFNGMPEEEVSKRTLPDHITDNLDIIIIGINPGLFAAYKGHHYAGPGNHFWKCLYLAGLTSQQMSADEDYKLLQVGIGFTNMVQRATKGSADLTRKEIKEGCQILLEKLRKFRPKIAVFNGKLIYEVFSGKKDFKFGRQPELVDGTNTHVWVMPSSSARCAQLPRAADKVPFYAALKKFRDYINGVITEIDESEMVFSEPRVKSFYEAEPKLDIFSAELTDISNEMMKNGDGIIMPCKKKRGRPKKIKVEGEVVPVKPIRKPPVHNNNCDFPKKKRGRPKKVKVENLEMSPLDNGSTNMSQCYPSTSPLQSPTNFYSVGPAPTPPSNMNSLYAPQPQVSYSQSPRPHYSQSPRPRSQPFTHSDLSSEISAAISSEHLGSPGSPSLGPPDFEPPTNMTQEEVDGRLSSPAPSTNGEQQPHCSYNTFNVEQQQQQSDNHYIAPRQQDIASKSLSGLESLVDQIPSITDGESPIGQEVSDQYPNQFDNYSVASRGSPAPYEYPSSSGYPIYPTPTWGSHYDPVPLPYPHVPYPQTYTPGFHMPSPNYPYYGYPQPAPAHPPGYPPYLGGF
ncbi:hypothetical protein WA026_004711 [Henosepilachna vigintioctopunctata]|uniref:G/T mismatch-specific thymine DNA glycosylase n=1 Tax=Henosepilachna vigintioctopunctata TaxID=420089 RepID=A0AAW1VAU8_9CUCU